MERFALKKFPDDKRAYRWACRAAHEVIVESMAGYIRDEIGGVADNPRLLFES